MSGRPDSGRPRSEGLSDTVTTGPAGAPMTTMRDPLARSTRVLAYGLVALAAAGFVLACVLTIRSTGPTALGRVGVLYVGILLVFPFVALGTLLSLRQPGNPIGWLLSVGGLIWLGGGLADILASTGLAGGGTEPSTPTLVAAFVGDGLWTLGFLFSVSLPLLLFPDGHLLSRSWRLVLWLTMLGAAVTFASWVLTVDPLASPVDPAVSLTNPWGMRRLAFLIGPAGDAGLLLFLAATLAAAVGIAVRFRSANSIERQQIRWVRAAGLLAVASMVIYYVGATLRILPTALFDAFASVFSGFAIACLPVAYSVAIMRYRLYDLDRIVSRTVSYAALTGLLVATYVGLVTAVSRLTPSGNSWAVALSTLTVAALFQPLRRWLQAIVDRRFNRSRYDAARTVEAFRTRLRSQVDIDAVRSDLLSVATDTMQPASAALWLRRPDIVGGADHVGGATR